jgi:phospholipid-binding lipoprotein MlaA
MKRGLAALALLLLASPAVRAADGPDADPWESANRRVFAFNEAADRLVIKPVAKGYVRALPQGARDALRNFVQNLGEPAVLLNNLLQGQFRRAAVTADRIALNSTFGLAGFLDLAAAAGHRHEVGDLGQTLHVWGVPEGPYVVIPLVGPSNPRDAVGLGVQAFVDPFRFISSNNHFTLAESNAPAVVRGIDLRARNLDTLDAVRKDSIDFYASLRSLFRQNREAELRGDDAPAPAAAGLYDDPGDPSPPKP